MRGEHTIRRRGVTASLRLLGVYGVGLAFITTGCKDTCNRNVTFTNMQAAFRESESATSKIVDIVWEDGETLPLKYFHQIFVIQSTNDPFGKPWQNDWQALESVQVSELGKISLYLNSSTSVDSSRLFNLHFSLPDRRGYIGCEHPGSPDHYSLDMSFQLKRDDSNKPIITDFIWKETLHKGGY